MADPFLEEQLATIGWAEYGATFTERFALNPSKTSGGRDYTPLIHPYPMREFDFSALRAHQELWDGLMSLFWRTYGGHAGFRLRAWMEWSTNGMTGTPTPTDQAMAPVGGLVWQLQKKYAPAATPIALGHPVRTIFKPVAGTVRVALGAVEVTNVGATRWTVDATTGKVTLAADKTRSVTSISKAASAVVGVGAGHPFAANDVVHFSAVGGMTQINGLRGLVTAVGASDITVAINSSAFSTYTSGGAVHTAPQSGEVPTAGCEFDFPVVFPGEIAPRHAYPAYTELAQVMVREKIAL